MLFNERWVLNVLCVDYYTWITRVLSGFYLTLNFVRVERVKGAAIVSLSHFIISPSILPFLSPYHFLMSSFFMSSWFNLHFYPLKNVSMFYMMYCLSATYEIQLHLSLSLSLLFCLSFIFFWRMYIHLIIGPLAVYNGIMSRVFVSILF